MQLPPFALMPPGSPGSDGSSMVAPAGAMPPPPSPSGPPPMPPGAMGPSGPSAPGLPPGAIGMPGGGGGMPMPPQASSPADMKYGTITQPDGTILLHLLNPDGTPGVIVDILQPPKNVVKQLSGGSQSSPSPTQK